MLASDLVTLHAGPTVPRDALHLVLDLEQRGCVMHTDGDSLAVGPRHHLTADDYAHIRQWKRLLIAILLYRAPEPAWIQ